MDSRWSLAGWIHLSLCSEVESMLSRWSNWRPTGLQTDSRWILDKKLAGLSPKKNCLNSRWTPGGVHLEYVGECKVLGHPIIVLCHQHTIIVLSCQSNDGMCCSLWFIQSSSIVPAICCPSILSPHHHHLLLPLQAVACRQGGCGVWHGCRVGGVMWLWGGWWCVVWPQGGWWCTMWSWVAGGMWHGHGVDGVCHHHWYQEVIKTFKKWSWLVEKRKEE